MFPDSEFAVPTSSFNSPVLPPTVEPGDSPNKTFTINCEYLPYIRGALQQLLLQSTWKTDDPGLLALTQSRIWNLIDIFQECSSGEYPFACHWDFTSSEGAWGLQVNPSATPTTRGFWLYLDGFASSVQNDGYGQYYTGIVAELVLTTPVSVSHVDMNFNLSKGLFYAPINQTGILLWHSGAVVYEGRTDSGSVPDGNNYRTHDFSTPVLVDKIWLMVQSGINTSPGAEGFCTISSFHMDGSAPSSPC